MRNFWELVEAKWQGTKALCVGHDPDPQKMPEDFKRRLLDQADVNALYDFCSAIVRATAETVACWKPNFAFFEAFGSGGINTLGRLIGRMHEFAPDVPVILDCKRGDIGNSNNGSAEMAFNRLGADAVTLSPYLGIGALEPFLKRPEKGCILLCRTSNPEAAELQDKIQTDGRPLYLHVADLISTQLKKTGNVGLVMGATYPEQLRLAREQVGDEMFILVPAIGTQGGKASEVVPVSYVPGKGRVLYNVSRAIIHASANPDFATVAQDKAREYDAEIRQYARSLNS